MDPKQILVDHGNRISAPFAQLPAELLSANKPIEKPAKRQEALSFCLTAVYAC
jgi:hypothetical protein